MRKFVRSLFEKIGILKVLEIFHKYKAQYFLRKNAEKIKGSGVIKVAFIVYEPGMWDKQEPIYTEMLKRDNIEPYLIVVDDVSLPEEKRKKKREFFIQKYENVLLYDEKILKRIKDFEFQYTFYQTPYNYKYPALVRPYKIVKYSKICFIPYAYIGSGDFFDVSSNVSFFENVYFGFMDSEPMLELLQEKFKKECLKGLQHFSFLGYPSLEYYFDLQNNEEVKSVLWLPRWSYAEVGGGSHFIEYKEEYNSLAHENPDIKWMMRPHPLMFNSLKNSGLMSENEIAEYKESMAQSGVLLDEYSLLNDTLENTDIMIADYSSVIIMYFLSGRPIIYCDGGIELSGIYTELREALYIANSWDEVLSFAKDLMNGIDPLKEKRLEIIAKEAKKHKGTTNRIVEAIVNDYRG